MAVALKDRGGLALPRAEGRWRAIVRKVSTDGKRRARTARAKRNPSRRATAVDIGGVVAGRGLRMERSTQEERVSRNSQEKSR